MQYFAPHPMVHLAVGVMIGCGMLVSNTVHVDTAFKDTEIRADVRPEAKSGLISDVMSETDDVVVNALGMIGLRYRFEGNTPESDLGCNGFVRYVFNNTFGFLLLRRAMETSRVGTSVGMAELRPGDLVFLSTIRHTLSHVGIHTGDNKFVHVPFTGNKIRVDDIATPYWVTRYDGVRRIEGNPGTAIRGGADSFVEQLKRADPNVAGKPLTMYGG